MARIFINKEAIGDLKSRLYSISNRVNSLESDIVRSLNRLDWEVSRKQEVMADILAARKRATDLARQSNQMRLFAEKAVNDFSSTDKRIAGMQRESLGLLERIWKGFVNYSSRIYGGLSQEGVKIAESLRKAGELFINREIELLTTNISNMRKGLEVTGYLVSPSFFIISELLRNRLQNMPYPRSGVDQSKTPGKTATPVQAGTQNIVKDPKKEKSAITEGTAKPSTGYDMSGTQNPKPGPVYTHNKELLAKIDQVDPKFDRELRKFKDIYEKHKNIYQEISEKTGIPPKLIAAIHYRESSCNFSTYLQNGDPLGEKTIHEPKGILYYTFEDAAVAALLDKKGIRNACNLSSQSNDMVAMLTFAESYNGIGYYKKGRVSPYAFSGTNVYSSGKYVGDGVYDGNVIDKQPGVYALLMALE